MLLMGKSTISRVIFNSVVKLPEGILWMFLVGRYHQQDHVGHLFIYGWIFHGYNI